MKGEGHLVVAQSLRAFGQLRKPPFIKKIFGSPGCRSRLLAMDIGLSVQITTGFPRLTENKSLLYPESSGTHRIQ